MKAARGRRSLLVAATLAASLLGGVSSAAAAVPTLGSPTATATTNTATISGATNLQGAASGTVTIQVGTTTSYGSTYTLAVSGSGSISYSKPLGGLSSGQTYHYKVGVSTAGGSATSGDKTFVTAATPQLGTVGAIQQSDTAENVITNVRTYGLSGTATIQYGTTTGYGATKTEAIPVGDDYVFAFELTGLTPGTVYHYKVSLTTAQGSTSTADKTFVTSAVPTIGTVGAIQQGDTAENVITNIRTFGKSGTATIQYGPTTGYGSTKTETIPTGDDYVFAFELTGLTPGTVYHYKVTLTTSRGTAVTVDKTFVTSAPPTIGTTGGITIAPGQTNLVTNIRTFGKSGTATIQYGPTTAYGSTKTETIPVVDSYAFAFELTGLTPGQVYNYKVTLTTSRGTATTVNRTFTAGS